MCISQRRHPVHLCTSNIIFSEYFMWSVTYVSLVGPGEREREIDKRFHLSRDMLTVHTLNLVLQLTLERPRYDSLGS